MKIFKLKHFLILMALGLLWSCQMEDIVSNSPDAIAAIKKQPLPDGVPSPADDNFKFDKTQYYHNGALIKDTTQIKTMVSNCSAMLISGNRRDLYVTDKEARVINNEYNGLQAKNASNKAAALDGDNYIHYFYETANYNYVTFFRSFYYFSLTGPNTYNVVKSIRIMLFTKTASQSQPVLDSEFTSSINSTPNKIIQLLSRDPFNDRPNQELSFTININNVTRYKRRVHFLSEDNRNIYFDIIAGQKIEVNGSQGRTGTYGFNGVGNFKILSHNSEKI